jgi:hypothetical protein
MSNVTSTVLAGARTPLRHLGLVAFAALLLQGCAPTSYLQERGGGFSAGGGYRLRGPGKLVKVGFEGFGAKEEAMVQRYAVFRAAEFAQAEQKPWFQLFRSLGDVLRDRPVYGPGVGMMGAKPHAFAFVLLLDEPRPKAKKTADVLAEMKAAGLGPSQASRPEATAIAEAGCPGFLPSVYPFKEGEPKADLRIVDSCKVEVCKGADCHKVAPAAGTQNAPIPASRQISVGRFLFEAQGNRHWSCYPTVSFTPQAGTSYAVDFNVVGTKCTVDVVRLDDSAPNGIALGEPVGP